MTLNWQYNSAKEQLVFLTALFGQPDNISLNAGGAAIWTTSLTKTQLFGLQNCFSKYMVIDQEIYSQFPVAHVEGQYGSVVIDIDGSTLPYVNSLSGSIIYDPNTTTLTARGATIYDVIVSLYLATRVVENPARIHDVQNNNQYARLLKAIYNINGTAQLTGLGTGTTTNANKPTTLANKPLVEEIYRGLLRVLGDLPPPPANRGYWPGAFTSTGSPATVDGQPESQALVDVFNSINTKTLADKKSKVQGVIKKHKDEEQTLSGTVWEPTTEDDATDTGETSHSSIVNNMTLPVLAPNTASATEYMTSRHLTTSVPLRKAKTGAVISVLKDNGSHDINLDIESLYKQATDRSVAVSSIEPLQSRFSHDINLGLDNLYNDAYDRPITINSVEPMCSRTDISPDEFERLENLESTHDWAHQVAKAVNLSKASLANGRRGKSGAEHYCGRRQYNPDIPPCTVHQDYPPNRHCDACSNVQVYETGLRPAESTDPLCFYRRDDAVYIDAASYMQHYEDNSVSDHYDPNLY